MKPCLSALKKYVRLSRSCVSCNALDFVPIRKTIGEAMTDPNWRKAMLEKMTTLHSNEPWEIVLLHPNKTTMDCRWVCTLKIRPDG